MPMPSRGLRRPLLTSMLALLSLFPGTRLLAGEPADIEQLQAVVQTYFDGMFESSAEKTLAAFHPQARISGVTDGVLRSTDVEGFAAFVATQPSAAAAGETPVLDILSLEIDGDTAVARVRDVYLGRTYLDTLTFLRIDGEWRIHDKIYHVER